MDGLSFCKRNGGPYGDPYGERASWLGGSVQSSAVQLSARCRLVGQKRRPKHFIEPSRWWRPTKRACLIRSARQWLRDWSAMGETRREHVGKRVEMGDSRWSVVGGSLFGWSRLRRIPAGCGLRRPKAAKDRPREREEACGRPGAGLLAVPRVNCGLAGLTGCM